MRRTCFTSVVVALFTGTTNAANIWLSEASIPPGSSVGEVPDILALPGSSSQINIYARPDPGETMANWKLNLTSSASGIIAFTNIDVVNPYLANLGPLGDNKDVFRYEFKNDSSTGFVISDPNALLGMAAFSVSNDEAVGVGFGEATKSLNDPAYDSEKDRWLIATVDYDVIGLGHTDWFLSIGGGLNQVGGDSSDIDVIFGDSVDEPRNGQHGREQPTTNPQARIWSVPEPTMIVLVASGFIVLAVYRRRHRP